MVEPSILKITDGEGVRVPILGTAAFFMTNALNQHELLRSS